MANAKAYFAHCSFDPSLLADTWVTPVSGNATPKVQSNNPLHKARSARDVPHSSDDSARESYSQPLAQSSPSCQQADHALPEHSDARRNGTRAAPQHRPTAREMINAHSSPVAPHLVPSREFVVGRSDAQRDRNKAPQQQPPPTAEMINTHSSPVAPHLVPAREGLTQPRPDIARAGSGQPRGRTSRPPSSYLPSQPQAPTADSPQASSSVPAKARFDTLKLPSPPEETTLPAPNSGLAAAVQAGSETNPKKRTANQSKLPLVAKNKKTSSLEHSEGPANKKKRASSGSTRSNTSATGEASAHDANTTWAESSQAAYPTPVSSTSAASPWASSLVSTATHSTHDGSAGEGNDGNRKR